MYNTSTGQKYPVEKMLLTEKEVEHLLNLSRSSIRRLMAQGQLRPLKVGRSLRFVAEEVAAYVESLKGEQRDACDGR